MERSLKLEKSLHVPGSRQHRGLMDALYEKPALTSFSTNLRVPASCDPKVPLPEKPFVPEGPTNLSATWSVRKAHMSTAEHAAMVEPAEDPMRAGRKGHKVLPGQFNVTWRDLEEELGFPINVKMLNLGSIGEGCSDPAALDRHVMTNAGRKYYGLCDNRKLWYSKEPAEMLFHETIKK